MDKVNYEWIVVGSGISGLISSEILTARDIYNLVKHILQQDISKKDKLFLLKNGTCLAYFLLSKFTQSIKPEMSTEGRSFFGFLIYH